MFNIAEYLEKFKKLGSQKLFLREIVRDVVFEQTGITLSEKDIEIKGVTARIGTKPVVRSEIFLKKDLIREKIKEKTEGKIADIIF